VHDNGRLRAKKRLATVLAGLEAGTVGVLWMLAWLGVSALWKQRSFWTPENLMSTAFDRNASLSGVSWLTCGGFAVYVVIYGLLGLLFAVTIRERYPRNRILLLGTLFGLVFYYFAYRWLFQHVLPMVALLHVERPTLLGHLFYGLLLGRYPGYVNRLMGTPPEIPVPSELPSPDPVPALETPDPQN
jgi:hypothetical protein